jgi:hypothetical protein
MKAAEPKEKKRGFWKKFYNFLAYGGIILVLFAIVGIVIAINIIFK